MRSASSARKRGILVVAVVARRQRHAGLLHQLPWPPIFEPIARMARRWRADEDDAGLGAGFGELLVLGQEAVAGMDRLRAGSLGRLEDALAAR